MKTCTATGSTTKTRRGSPRRFSISVPACRNGRPASRLSRLCRNRIKHHVSSISVIGVGCRTDGTNSQTCAASTKKMYANNQLALAFHERDKGVRRVSSKNTVFISTACGIARLLCRQKGQITADDLREEAAKRGVTPTHFNCWGALCRSPEWLRDFEFVGFTKSTQKQGHGNRICIYRLRNEF